MGLAAVPAAALQFGHACLRVETVDAFGVESDQFQASIRPRLLARFEVALFSVQ